MSLLNKQHQGNDRLGFLCDVDMGEKEVPATWSDALTALKNNYANSLVISALADVLHYKILIVTAHGVNKVLIVFTFVPPLLDRNQGEGSQIVFTG